MRYYCTYFDKNYLIKAMNLLDSLERFEAQPYMVFAICLDELSRVLLEQMHYKNITLVPLHEIEYNDQYLADARQNRTLVEYYWTLTPIVLKKLLTWHGEIDYLTYIDADCYFFSDPQPIYNELGDGSVLIHGHRFSPELQYLERNGKYNVGLLVFKNDLNAHAVLDWWGARCLEYCSAELIDGKFGDQKYLDSWEDLFQGVTVLQNPGAGLAPWNHIQYSYTVGDGTPLVNARPLIFYHFHSFAVPSETVIVPMKYKAYKGNRFLLEYVYLPYVEQFVHNKLRIREVLPSFTFGNSDQVELNHDLIFLGDASIRHQILAANIPHKLWSLSENWDCFYTDQLLTEEV
jgi:hypothetical protein